MTFVRLVIKELNCPRCNAIAQLRIEEERGDACVVYIVCSKCKLREYKYLTTRKAVSLMGKQEKLLKQLEEVTSEAVRSRIRGQLARIREQITKSNLGIGG